MSPELRNWPNARFVLVEKRVLVRVLLRHRVTVLRVTIVHLGQRLKHLLPIQTPLLVAFAILARSASLVLLFRNRALLEHTTQPKVKKLAQTALKDITALSALTRST
jgi:hypothetical protein